MLQIVVPGREFFDEATSEFVNVDPVTLELEHSLVSLSKWESHFEKSFLSSQEKTDTETRWYIRAMNLTPDIAPEVFLSLSQDNIDEINQYINARMTATFVSEEKSRPSQEVITSELIYYWMISLQIPFECQSWHLNRLLMLIKVCNRKNSKPAKSKRLTGQDLEARRQLNAQRKAASGTKG